MGQGKLEGIEGLLMILCLDKNHMFLQQISQRFTDYSEVFDKLSIIICKSQKTSELLLISRGRPVRDLCQHLSH